MRDEQVLVQPCCNVMALKEGGREGRKERRKEGRKEGKKERKKERRKVLTDDWVRAWNCILVQIML